MADPVDTLLSPIDKQALIINQVLNSNVFLASFCAKKGMAVSKMNKIFEKSACEKTGVHNAIDIM